MSPTGKILRKLWFAFWRFITRYLYERREYTVYLPFGYRVFTPWFWKELVLGISKLDQGSLSGRQVVSPDRAYVLYYFCKHSLNLPGDMAECGVYRGTTAYLLSLAMSERPHDKKLHLFDTFAGMPDVAILHRDSHSSGDFADTSLAFVKERLQRFPFVEYHAGMIPETFKEVSSVQVYSFVHIDVVNYTTALECCKWFWPQLCSGGSIVFDDYGFYAYRHSVRAAVDEFFADCQEAPLALHSGQAVVIKP